MTGRRLAVIPARGGSKRLPKKNLMAIGGQPMLVWTIRAALDSKLFDTVIVSTDDEEISHLAEAAGARVPFVRDTHADDHSPVSMVTIDAIERLQQSGDEFTTVAQLMANCPLRTASHIIDAVRAFDASGTDFQVSCFRFGYMNPWWALRLNQDFTGTALFPEAWKARSQDLPPLYCPSGAIWLARPQALIKKQRFHGSGCTYFPMPWDAAIDIDDQEDFDLAEALLHRRRRHT